MPDASDLAAYAAALRSLARLGEGEIVDGITVARRLLGADGVVQLPRLPTTAALVRIQDRPRVLLLKGVRDASFLAYHELAHWFFEREGIARPHDESQVDAVAAQALAPETGFRRVFRAANGHLPRVASALATTQSMAALRWGEVLRVELALVAPHATRVRSTGRFSWPAAEVIRKWERQPVAGLRKTKLSDDRKRSVLVLEGS